MRARRRLRRFVSLKYLDLFRIDDRGLETRRKSIPRRHTSNRKPWIYSELTFQLSLATCGWCMLQRSGFSVENEGNVTCCFLLASNIFFLPLVGFFSPVRKRGKKVANTWEEKEKTGVEGKPPAAKRSRVPLSWTNLNISSARAACKSISRAEIYGRGAYGCFI